MDLRRARSDGGTYGRTVIVLIGLYGVVLAAITGLNLFGAEHSWLGAFNLYLPQILWAAPAAVLLVTAPRARRRWLWLPLLYLVWVLGPIMGLCWSRQTPPGPAAGPGIRILTCNAKYGYRDSDELINDIVRYRPQVVLLQDADGLLAGHPGKFFKTWQVRSFHQYVIASRLPLSAGEVLWVDSQGDRQAFLRCRLTLGARIITLYDVHFQSPREALNAFRTPQDGRWQLADAIQELEQNAAVRLDQARAMRAFIRAEPGPVILTGDFNSTEASRVCATLRDAGLQDAFSAGGRGYGYTYGHFLLQYRIPWLHLSWMRIDHIMASAPIHSWRCWVGNGKASDHRPVIADLTLAEGVKTSPGADPT
jgi:endonuclease/exonuclease/phosphatase (EEP) superfamily protein YafD